MSTVTPYKPKVIYPASYYMTMVAFACLDEIVDPLQLVELPRITGPLIFIYYPPNNTIYCAPRYAAEAVLKAHIHNPSLDRALRSLNKLIPAVVHT